MVVARARSRMGELDRAETRLANRIVEAMHWNQPFITLRNACIFGITSLLGCLFCVRCPVASLSSLARD